MPNSKSKIENILVRNGNTTFKGKGITRGKFTELKLFY